MRTFLNILTIILIGLLSSTYLFTFSPIDYRNTLGIEDLAPRDTVSLHTDENADSSNPNSITISHTSDTESTLTSLTNSIFSVNVYKNSELVKSNIENLELVSISPTDMKFDISKDKPLVTTLDISQKTLGVDDGTYTIIFQSNLITDPEYSSISVEVKYESEGIYYPASLIAPTGTRGLTLYFPTDNADTVVPVTRFITEDKPLTRIVIEQLQKGPLADNMNTSVGDVKNCVYNNGNVIIDLPSTYVAYNQGSSSSLAYESFVKSMFALDKYWPIYSVNFTVDNAYAEDFFHGIYIGEPKLRLDDNYSVYMAYKIGERYFLFDSPVPDIAPTDTIEIKSSKIFESYNKESHPYGKSPVPKNLVLKSSTFNMNTLTLDFDSTFLNIYSGRDDLRLMMVESLIYSYTSMSNVYGIVITVEGLPLTDFVTGKNLSGILYPPEFINPEIVQ